MTTTTTEKGGRPSTIDYSEWPKICPGGCRRLTRPYKSLLTDFPDTILSANQSGMCNNCFRRSGVHPARPAPARNEAEEQARIRSWRSDLIAFIDARRRRGVSPEGIVLPGEARQYAVALPYAVYGATEEDYEDQWS